ncbi:GH32 C-terminal domain-containing protein [Haloferacaceae archaeon DSL9]
MDGLPIRVACLYERDRSAEQQAAYDWCGGSVAVADRISLDSIASGAVNLEQYDAAWWHRDRPVEPTNEAVAEAAEPLRTAIENGFGLVLSLHAMTAVEPLGIDPIGPDAVGTETTTSTAGFLTKAVYERSSVFESFDGRVETRPSGVEQPFARYESVVPERGLILASEVRGDDLLVGHKLVCAWRLGAGGVVGIGSCLGFTDAPDDERGIAQARLIENALVTLSAGEVTSVTDRPATPAETIALRESLAGDHHRPTYHLAAPANWLNDPNGLIHHDGKYHIFYQYNPAGPFHGTIHWGHAVSRDLLRWEDAPTALAPSIDGPDRDGCWSGCAVVDDDGTLTAIYTGGEGRDQLPCLATAGSALERWEKASDNPVITEVPTAPALLSTGDWAAEFRDHCVWRDDGTWYQLIGAGLADGGGTALLYRGETLRDWEYVGPLFVGDWEPPGTVWECPELLDFGDTQVLHVSNYRDVWYFVGEVDLETPDFAERRREKLDYGDFYAPQSLEAADGRYLMWGWLQETRDLGAQWRAGWSGMLSVPRELDLHPDGRLRQRPAAELAALRKRRARDGDIRLKAGQRRAVDLDDNAAEIRMEIDLDPGATFELGLFESPALSERTRVRYAGDELVVDRSLSSHDPAATSDERRMPVADGPLSLCAYVDRSSIELFANEHRCLTTRVYPTNPAADGVSIGAHGGAVSIRNVGMWELESTFPAGGGAARSTRRQ